MFVLGLSSASCRATSSKLGRSEAAAADTICSLVLAGGCARPPIILLCKFTGVSDII